MDHDRRMMEWIHSGHYHGLWGAVVMFIFAMVGAGAGFPFPLVTKPLLFFPVAIVVGYVAGRGVGYAVLHGSGSAAQQVYMPGAKGSYAMQFSQIDALEAKGNYAGAVDAWEKVAIAQPSNPWPLIRAGELYLRTLRDPATALERFRAAQAMPTIAREHHLYVSQKIVDLYLGPMGDEGRALVELRKIVVHHEGSREAEHAREAIGRMKRQA